MDRKEHLSDLSITIIGLGLMGGSLALALHGRCKKLFGIDKDDRTIEISRGLNIFDGVYTTYPEDFSTIDVIILAVPVLTIIETIREIPAIHKNKAIILDLGSTKSQIMEAMQELPGRFDPIGGHPMCGKEKSTIQYAEPDLFNGANFVLTPLERTTHRAREIAEDIVKEIGAIPLWLDAKTNDKLTAVTSHLPYLMANALSGMTPIEYSDLAGTGFRSATRLSGSSISMMVDILKTNRKNILESLKTFINRLESIYETLDQNDEALLVESLIEGKRRYKEILRIKDEQDNSK